MAKDGKDRKKRPKRLHLTATDAERSLWDLLRDRQVAGVRFMRHVAVGRLIIDFVSREQRIAVAIEGGRHSNPKRDEDRGRALVSRGYRILRVREEAVLKNPERVCRAIEAALLESLAGPDKNIG